MLHTHPSDAQIIHTHPSDEEMLENVRTFACRALVIAAEIRGDQSYRFMDVRATHFPDSSWVGDSAVLGPGKVKSALITGMHNGSK